MMLSSEYIPRDGFDFDFDDEIWFENGSQPLLITHKVKHSGKDHEKNFKRLSQLYTQAGVYIRHM